MAAPSDTTKSKTADPKDGKSKKADAKKADTKKTDSKKPDGKKKDSKEAKDTDRKTSAKPVQVGSFDDWGAFLAQAGKDKTCYVLASPERPGACRPSTRPGLCLHLEPAGGKCPQRGFDHHGLSHEGWRRGARRDRQSGLRTRSQGPNAWVKNPAEETQFIDAMKKSGKLVVKAPSLKGNVTTDNYSLKGFSQALDKVQKECP